MLAKVLALKIVKDIVSQSILNLLYQQDIMDVSIPVVSDIENLSSLVDVPV